MKKTIVFYFMLIGSLSINFATGINFIEITSQEEWYNALKKAKKIDKLIYIDIYADWCAPCKMLDKKTFPDPEVGKYYNREFLNLKMDGEIIIGELLMQQYKLDSYPSGLYLSVNDLPNEEEYSHRLGGEEEYWPAIVTTNIGYVEADEFLEKGQSILQLQEKTSKWEAELTSGEISLDAVYNYVLYLAENNRELDAEKVSLSYLANLSVNDLLPYKTWEMIKSSVRDMNLPLTNRILENKDQFIHMRGEEEFTGFLVELMKNNLDKAAEENDEQLLEKTLRGIIPLLANDIDQRGLKELELLARREFYYNQGKYDKYISLTDDFIVKYAPNDGDYLFEQVKEILTDEETDLYGAAERWAKRSVEIESDFGNNLLYIHILIRNNKHELAEEKYKALSERDLDSNQREYLEEVKEKLEN